MNLKRYCTLVLLVSSSLCYGEFDSSSLKHASLGIGKLGLGIICGYIGYQSAFQHSASGSNNKMLLDLEYCYENWDEDHGISGALFQNNTYDMNTDLMDVLNKGCLTGVSFYGAYRCITSAAESFKKAWKPKTATAEQKKDSNK